MMEFLEGFYQQIRNTLVWFVIYFIIQTVLLVALAILILIYPEALFILVAICFIGLAVVSLYFAAVFIKYTLKLKKIKDLLK